MTLMPVGPTTKQFATINETIEQLHNSLREYIEAAYHISDPRMLEQRRALLDELGIIHQKPYLESTPRYVSTRTFKEIPGLDFAIAELLTTLAQPRDGSRQLLFDPPYKHQAESLEETLVRGKSV